MKRKFYFVNLFFIILLLLFIEILQFVNGFNIDTSNPTFRFGKKNTFFGFSLAQHFVKENPVLIVGAPRANSEQPGTVEAGAIFSCVYDFHKRQSLPGDRGNDCSFVQVEYPTEAEFHSPVQKLNSKRLHGEGKNHQLLGFVVQSTGVKNGQAMVCAPLLRYGLTAFTDGTCYLLNSELNHTGLISSCNPLPKNDRHNDYGACEQGFSGFIDKNVILTGLPGARKWTGGVFGRYEFNSNGFPDTVDRWTMEVNKEQNGIINILASHDYLGYSVCYGKFGFWYEENDGSNFTIVSGATRYLQLGAVVFLPFRKNSHPEEERILGLDNNFTIIGRQLGSGFGYAVEVLDLNADGFDDLIISAPFEFYNDEDIEYGGAVYIYYSNGKRQKRGSNEKVFRKPIILRVQGAHSQFGTALTKLGNLDNDPQNFQDFAVGAPQFDDGHGAVFVYHGAQPDSFSTKFVQEIRAKYLILPQNKDLRSFGAALAGGVDMDGNEYGELAVGAYESDTVVVFRTRPVVDVKLGHEFVNQYVKIDNAEGGDCPSNSRTCFQVTTAIKVANRNNTIELLNFNEEPFICILQIIPYSNGISTRGFFVDRDKQVTSWACGRNALRHPQKQTHRVYISKNNQDWTNPIKFNFTVEMRERRVTELLPIINQQQAEHIFDISFDKKCGQDNDCHTNLVLNAILLNMTHKEDGVYLTKVTERDSVVLRIIVKNQHERAFLARLYLHYNQDELDVPQLLNKVIPGIGKLPGTTSVDIVKKDTNLVVLNLGNPFEENKKLTFDLSFNLVRGSSERVSTSLIFDAFVNSSSIEDDFSDNKWKAEVQLIKEAELQLEGVSRPPIVRFSKGNLAVTDEEDVGSQVIHTYTLTNHGPFYARNVTVTINWPLKLNTKHDNWVLYTLEEPVIRHNGEIRKCRVTSSGGINPLNVYNDEIQKLTYLSSSSHQHQKRPKRAIKAFEQEKDVPILYKNFNSEPLKTDQTQIASIFDSKYIRPKEIEESSGSKVRIVDVNCKDDTAICYPLICHFDYIGTNDAALIEIRSRLWNYTFSGDYKGIEYIAITSDGFVEVDPAQGILENVQNNFAQVTTHAYPDRPYQEDRLDIWLIILAILVGLLLLSILTFICWRCGFFKRKRHDITLHQANYTHQMEQYSET